MNKLCRLIVLLLLVVITGCSSKYTVREDGKLMARNKVANGWFLEDSSSETYDIIVVDEGIIVEEISYKSKLIISKKLFSVKYYRDNNVDIDNRDIIFYDTEGEEFLKVVIRRNEFLEGSYRKYDDEFQFTGETDELEDLEEAYMRGTNYMRENFESY